MIAALKSAASEAVEKFLASPTILRAFECFESRAEAITEEHIRICSIPAPPFGEQERARYLCERFRSDGLLEASIDDEGNCLALRKGRLLTPLLAVTAHLDTVFPLGTDFTVTRVANRLLAPGVSDDGCGLAALIALN